MAAVFCEAVNESRARLALFPTADLTTEPPAQLNRTDHVSPCPQSAGAAMQVRAGHSPGRVYDRASGHA